MFIKNKFLSIILLLKQRIITIKVGFTFQKTGFAPSPDLVNGNVLSKELTDPSLPEIGEAFGERITPLSFMLVENKRLMDENSDWIEDKTKAY